VTSAVEYDLILIEISALYVLSMISDGRGEARLGRERRAIISILHKYGRLILCLYKK
jgi:hypothetical protein